MKLFVLVAFFFVSSVSAETKVKKNGQLCLKAYCDSRAGHFSRRNFYVNPFFAYEAWKMIWSAVPTNFVVYIYNIKTKRFGPVENLFGESSTFMELCNEYKCDTLNSDKDQVFIFKDITYVRMTLKDSSASFDVQYYGGCDILDSTELVKSGYARKSGSPFTQRGFCWVLIPRLYEGATNQYAASTNFIFSGIKIPANSSISMFNVLTGHHLHSVKESRELDVINLMKAEKSVVYQQMRFLSSVLLLQVDACPQSLAVCSQLAFKIDVQALNADKYKCFRRKEVCDYQVMQDESEEEIDCKKEKSKKCESYNDFENTLEKALLISKGQDPNAVMRSTMSVNWLQRCKGIFTPMKARRNFCARNGQLKIKPADKSTWNDLVKCSRFKKCQLYCVIKRSKGLCPGTSLSHF